MIILMTFLIFLSVSIAGCSSPAPAALTVTQPVTTPIPQITTTASPLFQPSSPDTNKKFEQFEKGLTDANIKYTFLGSPFDLLLPNHTILGAVEGRCYYTEGGVNWSKESQDNYGISILRFKDNSEELKDVIKNKAFSVPPSDFLYPIVAVNGDMVLVFCGEKYREKIMEIFYSLK